MNRVKLACNDRLDQIQLVLFDFDGVFTDNKVYVSENGVETVCCWRGDGIGISKLKSAGIAAAIVSTEVNAVVSARANKLGVECHQGVIDKASKVREIASQKKLPLSQVAFVGNDVNDLPALNIVGFPIVVADAYPMSTEFEILVTEKHGGIGVVREVCELIVARKEKEGG